MPTPSPHADEFDRQALARLARRCLDLTSLNDGDTESDIVALCQRAASPHGSVAAVCVWPRFVAVAVKHVPAGVRVAAVANFPDGALDAARAVRDTCQIVDAGGHEVDVVLPYRALMAGDLQGTGLVLNAVRRACEGLTLKVILETGELLQGDAIRAASRLALEHGADFLKTSTGKTTRHASIEAATLMLESIAADDLARRCVGLKPSGGLRTLDDVLPYVKAVGLHLGSQALTPKRFRLGASGLLSIIDAALEGVKVHFGASSTAF